MPSPPSPHQAKAERLALLTAWESDPAVAAFRKACLEHAIENNLSYNPAGITAMGEFATQWFAENGYLPDSGIQIG